MRRFLLPLWVLIGFAAGAALLAHGHQISPAKDYDNSDLAAADSGHSLVGSALLSGSSGAYAIDVQQCTRRWPRARHDPPYDPPRLPQRRQIGSR